MACSRIKDFGVLERYKQDWLSLLVIQINQSFDDKYDLMLNRAVISKLVY